MKKNSLLPLILIFFASVLTGQDDAAYLNEISAWAKKEMEDLPAPSLRDRDISFTPEELDAYIELATERAEKKDFPEEAQEFIVLLESTAKEKEKFNGNEAEFHPDILENPLKEIGIASTEYVESKTETILRTCEEAGEYEREFEFELITKEIPKFKIVQKCKGHNHEQVGKIHEDHLKKGRVSNEKKNEIKKKFAANPDIAVLTYIDDKPEKIFPHDKAYAVFGNFSHKDNASSCTLFELKEEPDGFESVQVWEADFPEEYARIEKRPHCKKVYVGNADDIRTVIFHCGPDEHSPCAPYQGGILVSQKCIQKNEDGDCEVYEKTYDIGKKIDPRKTHTFEGGLKLWGLNGEFDEWKKTDKNSDLPKLLAALNVLSDIPLGDREDVVKLNGQREIFKGMKHECNCNRKIGELYDCCNAMKGLVSCEPEEIKLKKLRSEGKCHKVPGSIKGGIFDGFYRRTKVYCCFPTKLLRIFNEQAREKMGLDWGKAKKPKCGGFALEEMDGIIPFESFNFNDVIGDYHIDEEAINQEIIEKINTSLADPDLKNKYVDAFTDKK